MAAESILLSLMNAAGDSVVMTAAVRDLALQFPGRFNVSIAGHCLEVWRNNPYIVPTPPGRVRSFRIRYGDAMSAANRPGVRTHFLKAFHDILGAELGVPLVPQLPRPDLHITPDETHPPVRTPYWVIFPGWKHDIPLKAWAPAHWQELVSRLAGWGIHCVQVGGKGAVNPIIPGAEILVGKTHLRQLFALIRDAEGVICGITQGMHIAAALEKPCVAIAGGREAWWWEAYVNQNAGFGPASGQLRVPHRYLHAIGALSCCARHGCSRRAAKIGALHPDPSHICQQLVSRRGMPVAACLDMITPAMVVDAALSYYMDGTLAPHNPDLEELRQQMPDLPNVLAPLQILRADGTQIEIRSSNTPSVPAAPSLPDLRDLPERPALAPHSALDDPIIGGRVTLCLLTYGDYFPMHKQCVDAILRSTPRERVELRVGGNALCAQSRQYLKLLEARGDISVLNIAAENRGKYPVMRELFRTPPLNTDWVVWFDDDTMCDIDPDWLGKMAEVALTPGCGAVGPVYRYRLTSRWVRWCAAASWYRHRQWPTRSGQPNILFPSGGCWMARRDAIYALDIPDVRLGHNKGDVTIGCQLFQGGFSVCNFSSDKEIVNWSAVPRRGITDVHPAEG